MNPISRRSFLQRTALASAALGLPASSWSQVAGANNDIRMAVVGFHGRGKDHINSITKLKGVRLVALCDVDKNVLDKEAVGLKAGGIPVESYTDIRKLLENKNVDAISIATPNHWHALAAIWGIQAGKDVYVEKPVSHNIWEGGQIVAAARKYSKIVQCGTQARSSTAIKQAVEWVNQGHLGKIKIARGLCYKPRASIGKTSGAQPIPVGLDYDLWCGPAPKDPPHRNSAKFGSIHYEWHWFWAYGAGDLGNQGVHQMDVARWFLGEKTAAPKVISIGGRLGYQDDAETPNTLMAYHDYAKAPLIFEVRGLPEKAGSKQMDTYEGAGIGTIIECEGGRMVVSSNYGKASAFDNDGKEIKKFAGDENHFGNFIHAVRSRKVKDLNADILEGHISATLCHTANISYRVGAKHSPDEIREQIKGNSAATATFDRMAEHLAANNVDLKKNEATLGMHLTFDPAAEKFVDNSAANELVTRHYRKPFVVPEKV